MKIKLTTTVSLIVILGALLSAGGSARQAEDPGVLLRAAIEKEEVEGNLQAAIELYKQIIAKYGDNRVIAAKALLRLGGCYEKLGEQQAGLAQKAYEKVIENYPDQTEAVSKAKEKLSAILRAQALIEKGDKEYKITKIHTDARSGYLSPDGKKLALMNYEQNNLWLRDIASGKEVCLLPTPELMYDCFWSPDSRLIAYINGVNSVKIVSADGGQPKTIIEADAEMLKGGKFAYPDGWTSDGKKLLFLVLTRRSREGLYAIPASGGKWEEIYKFPDPQKANERGEWLHLSPNGKFIAYQSKQDGNMDIYVMPSRGAEPVRITDDPARDEWPRWSYDGQWLLFTSDRTGEAELWVIRIRPDGQPGSRPIQVTRGGADGGSWTQGGKIAFSTSTDLTHVFIANMDGSQETQLTGQYKTNYSPRWSPDGKNIAFVAYYGEGVRTGVMTVPSNGGDAKFLARGMSPAWSPDGKRIAYCYERRSIERPTGRATISIIPAEGGEAKEVMNYDGYVNYLDWSPDGRNIAFSYNREEGPNPIPDSRQSNRDIYIVSVTGGEPKRLTRIDKKELFFVSPRWSPDGKKIAYLWSNMAGLSETGTPKEPACIYTIDVGGGEPKLVTNENPIWWFCWTPDGKNIIFSKREEEAGLGLYKVSAEGGKAKKLNILGGGPDLSPDGKKIVFFRKIEGPTEFWLVENFLPEEKK